MKNNSTKKYIVIALGIGHHSIQIKHRFGIEHACKIKRNDMFKYKCCVHFHK